MELKEILGALEASENEKSVLTTEELIESVVRTQDLKECCLEFMRDHAEQLRTLFTASQALVDKLDTLDHNSEYQAVWHSYYNHGGRYEGPTYGKELSDLKHALKGGTHVT
jgi:hypothetical protein